MHKGIYVLNINTHTNVCVCVAIYLFFWLDSSQFDLKSYVLICLITVSLK